ncbi:helix-turn-helix transcriptional regulator [Nocardia carnea]|uniref:Helix-turn-helix transcriptional regulator n=1 Tax=Nocardia carnea TaxID=37328 RepID=A0ABW7TK33_9NOCA|nr:metalloregulator ArsR/SmtB family transcription factor [Nocardia carnea]
MTPLLVRAPLLDFGNEFRHTDVVKTVGLPNVDERAGHRAGTGSVGAPVIGGEGQTRAAIIQLLLEDGPITATAVGAALGLAPAGVRRHLDALIESGHARAGRSAPWQQKGRGRPAKQYQLTAAGRSMLGHAYDDLAGAAIRQLREIGGEDAVTAFARKRARTLVDGIDPLPAQTKGQAADPGATGDDTVRSETVAKADEIATALSDAGFAASTRRVGAGVQICQHHCPVSHVAEEFPELCEAELEAFREVLGTHVQRLATIANGDCACTTHVPLTVLPDRAGGHQPNNASPSTVAQPAADVTNDSGRSAE